jgi:hypothetical protein
MNLCSPKPLEVGVEVLLLSAVVLEVAGVECASPGGPDALKQKT